MAPSDVHSNGTGGGPGGAYPYPPAPGQQQGGITAPGGYPAVPHPSDTPVAYPPQGNMNPAYPPQPMYAGHSTATVGPQAAHKPPVGYPVSGGADIYPPQDSAHPQSGHAPAYNPYPQQAQGGKEPCACSVGWVLFAIGFIFWPCWVAAAFVPLCTKTVNDRRAAIASTIGMLLLVIAGIIIGATSSRWRNTGGGTTYYYYG